RERRRRRVLVTRPTTWLAPQNRWDFAHLAPAFRRAQARRDERLRAPGGGGGAPGGARRRGAFSLTESTRAAHEPRMDVAAGPQALAEASARPAGLRFADVYEALFAFVWRSVRRLGVDEGAVDDVVQEIFVIVHRRLHDFEGRSSVKTWIFGIVLRV